MAGIVTVVGAFSKLHAASHSYDFTESSRFGWAVVFAGAMAVTAYLGGLPDLPRRRGAIALTSTVAACTGALSFSALQLAVGGALLPRAVVFATTLILIPWYGLCSVLASDGRSRDEARDRVVVVGSWADAATLAVELEHAERPATVIDVLSLEEALAGLPKREALIESVRAGDATVVVLDRDAQLSQSIIDQVARLHESGVRVRTLSLFYEEWLGKLPVSELERVSLMFDIGELHRVRYSRVKRVLDVSIATVGVLVLLALTPFVLAGNLCANRGSLLFRQTRVGRNGTHFTIYKFRTMAASDVEIGTWTEEDDPRITPFGRLLRRSHIDELPQVVNVLKGDLAIVGPRPEQPHYVEQLENKLPFYRLRHLVRPGLTGWAQVKYGYAGNESDALEKLQYEFYYLRRQSLAFDLRVMVRTTRSVLRGAGR
ncbi:MAG TPA: sugar transferase [Acidimicrobiales bacterium]|nr:sugar transferase [Acidimicrobiales bacterium]